MNSLQLCSCRPSSATIVGHCHAVVPRTYTRLGDRAFPVAGPRLWQSLLSNLRQSDLTLLQFRWALKMYLFGWLGLQHLVTFVFSVVYKCSYLLTYLLTTVHCVVKVKATYKLKVHGIKGIPIRKTWPQWQPAARMPQKYIRCSLSTHEYIWSGPSANTVSSAVTYSTLQLSNKISIMMYFTSHQFSLSE